LLFKYISSIKHETYSDDYAFLGIVYTYTFTVFSLNNSSKTNKALHVGVFLNVCYMCTSYYILINELKPGRLCQHAGYEEVNTIIQTQHITDK